MGPLDEREVTQVAALARLELTPEEVARLGRELGAVLDYVGQLSWVRPEPEGRVRPEPEGGEQVVATLEAGGRLRDDEPGPSLPVEAALANAPARGGDSFLIPRILEEA